MNKISIRDQQRLERLNDELLVRLEAVLPLLGPVREALAEAEEKRAEIEGVLDDIRREIQETYDSRSEKWRDGNKGDSYYRWLTEVGDLWMSVTEEIALNLPESLDELTPAWMKEIIEGNYSVEPAE